MVELVHDRDRDHGEDVGLYPLLSLPQRPSVAASAISTGWSELDEIFKFYFSQFVVITGAAGHGKSTFILNVLCNIARRDGIRSFAYVPENEQHLVQKLRRVWGDDRSFEMFAADQFFVQTSSTNDYRLRNVLWVLERAERAITKHGCNVVLIDPWNEIERSKPKDQMLTDYIGDCLMMIKTFCRQLDAIVIMVAHPTKLDRNTGRTVSLYDIEGSANWANKSDNVLVVERDKGNAHTSKVISQKARELGAGKLGVAHFYVDAVTEKFTPQQGGVYEQL